MEKELGVTVKKKKAQQAIELLDDLNLRFKTLKPKKSNREIIIPVKAAGEKDQRRIKKALNEKKIDFKFQKIIFEKQPKKAASLKETLKDKLSGEELKEVIASYNVFGDIAVIEIPDSLKGKKKLIAQALLDSNPQLKTVLQKAGKTKGKYRVHPVKVLAGEKKKHCNLQGVRLSV